MVLLTAIEYLREEEQEKKESEDCPDTRDAVSDSEEDNIAEPSEALDIPEMKKPRVNYVPMLLIIGKFHFMLDSANPLEFDPQRRKLCPCLCLLPSSSTLELLQSFILNRFISMYSMFNCLHLQTLQTKMFVR